MLERIMKRFKKSKEPVREPVKGEQWVVTNLLKKSDDPFGFKGVSPVKIHELRKGWVRYGHRQIYTDQRMAIEDFVKLYSPCPEHLKIKFWGWDEKV